MVVTEEFVGLAKAAARARGYPDLPMVVLPHPFETKSAEEVERIAVEKVEELVQKLTAPASPVRA